MPRNYPKSKITKIPKSKENSKLKLIEVMTNKNPKHIEQKDNNSQNYTN